MNYFLSLPRSGHFSKLLVLFSDSQGSVSGTYDLREIFNKLEVATLHILDDFGDQGPFSYSRYRSSPFFESTQSLITQTLIANGLSKEDTATVGFGKGVNGATIHGLTLGAGRILCGFPPNQSGTSLEDADRKSVV